MYSYYVDGKANTPPPTPKKLRLSVGLQGASVYIDGQQLIRFLPNGALEVYCTVESQELDDPDTRWQEVAWGLEDDGFLVG